MRKITITPTWTEILRMLLTIYEDGDPEGRAKALAELRRMAAAADQAVEDAK